MHPPIREPTQGKELEEWVLKKGLDPFIRLPAYFVLPPRDRFPSHETTSRR